MPLWPNTLPASNGPAGPEEDFLGGKYSRAHRWSFDGGVSVPASSSPHVVRVPLSDPAGVDPEEAFVAAASSCHMLTFVWLASRKGFTVDSYVDNAVGIVAKDPASGRYWVSRITLHPAIKFSGDRRPTPQEHTALHHTAHEECFIANSVRSEIKVEATIVADDSHE
jgi:organic hydroperoxide reductase OsmC/OhrA